MATTLDRLYQILDNRGIGDAATIRRHRGSATADFATDLGLDSLDLVELREAVWDEYDFDVPDDVGEKVSTLGDLAKLIDEQVALMKAGKA